MCIHPTRTLKVPTRLKLWLFIVSRPSSEIYDVLLTHASSNASVAVQSSRQFTKTRNVSNILAVQRGEEDRKMPLYPIPPPPPLCPWRTRCPLLEMPTKPSRLSNTTRPISWSATDSSSSLVATIGKDINNAH